jgi:hypothetical protein
MFIPYILCTQGESDALCRELSRKKSNPASQFYI